MIIIENCLRNSKIALKFKIGKSWPRGSWVIDQNRQYIVLINNLLKNCMAYLNFKAIFVFLRQLASGCLH